MKFARYLEENVVVEWRRAYINYRGLKKLIKRVDARYKARTALDLARQPSHGSSSLRSFSVAALRKRRRGLSGDDDNSEAGGSDAALVDASARGAPALDDSRTLPQKLPLVSLEGTGVALSWREEPPEASNDGSQDSSPSSSGIRAQTSQVHDGAQDAYEADVEARAANVSATMTTSYSKPAHDRRPQTTDKSDTSLFSHFHKRTDASEPHEIAESQQHHQQQRKKKANGKKEMVRSFDVTLAKEFDSEERKFFSALDNELERIVSFYLSHERDMTKRYEMLASQLQELSEHRREYKAKHAQAESRTLGGRLAHFVSIPQPATSIPRLSAQLKRETASHAATASTSKSAERTETFQKEHQDDKVRELYDGDGKLFDAGDKRRAEALAKMLNITGGTLSEMEDEQLRKENLAAAMSHNSEHYRSARKQLKAAILEYYRGLEILKNYKVLNRTGFAKIVKKFEKTTGVHVADAYYRAKVTPSVLVSSDVIEKLLKSTEETYTAYFEHGNRKRALERLRINTASSQGYEHFSSHYGSVTRTGFYLGITLCAFVGGFVNAYDPVKRASIPLWQELLRVYGAEFLPTLFALLFGLNLVVWHHARVNTVFIFEWDVRHALDYHQYFEMPAFFLMLLSIAFWVSFLNPFPQAIAPTTWPLVWLIVVLVILLNPLPILHYHSRRWLITSFGRVLHGGLLSGVEFRDFFLGDELNSLAWPLSMIWFFGCEYQHDWAYPNRCDPNKTFWTAVLLSLPALLRFLQCFRRYYDSKFTANLHLINAGKYSMTILNYMFYINYRYHGSHRAQDLALWCVFGSIYAIYASAWDILMDWSLLQRVAKYPLLRKSLVYEDYWPIYYWAMITNVILRFGWTIYLMPGPASNLTRIFLIAMLEALRRWQWNFFRLENEHLGNVDMYRVSREVPLPYTVPKRSEHDEDDDDEQDKSSQRKPIILKALGRMTGRGMPSTSEPSAHEYPPVRKGKTPNSSDDDQVEDNGRGLPSSISLGKSKAIDRDVSGSSKDTAGLDGARAGHASHVMETGKPFLQQIRDALVPDRGGLMASGPRLDDIGAAKGAKARDYQPRSVEGDAEMDSTTSRSSGEEEGEEDAKED